MEDTYSISEVAKILQIEQNNLRNIERQLDLSIPRGATNRRYYREEDVKLLKDIQLLRTEGYQLRMIKMILPNISEVVGLESGERKKLRTRMKKIIAEGTDDSSDETTEETECHVQGELTVMDKQTISEIPNMEIKGHAMLGAAMRELLQCNNKILLEEMDTRISQRIMKEMNYLFRERENLEEERYRKLDRTIREYQAARQTMAVQEERRTLFLKRR